MSEVPAVLPPAPDPTENPPADSRPFFGGRTYQWYREASWFAQQIYASGVLAEHINSKEKAFAILCKGDELGLPPFASWTFIYPTKQQRLAILSKGALAVVQSKPTFELYEERVEDEGKPEMRGMAVAKRRGHPAVVKEFSLADAEKAGLLARKRNREGKEYDGPWQSFVKDMLLSRARARALDIAFAAELGGIPIEGVAEDIDAAEDERGPRTPAKGMREGKRPALPPASPVRDTLLDELSPLPAVEVPAKSTKPKEA